MKVLTILSSRTRLWIPLFAGFVGFLMIGCQHTPIDLSRPRLLAHTTAR
jgi:hypothetical protein